MAGRRFKLLSFACDASAGDLTAAFLQQTKITVIVNKYFTSSTNSSWAYKVGYADLLVGATNWYQPYVSAGESRISISTLQEGGYSNIHYNAVPVTSLVQSVFVLNASFPAVLFNLSWAASGGLVSTGLIDTSSTKDLSSTISAVINTAAATGAAVSVSRATYSTTPYVEYRVTFSAAFASSSPSRFSAQAYQRISSSTVGSLSPSSVYVLKLLDAKNFPVFLDSKVKVGYSNSGKYTCYKRSQAYVPWSYYAGSLNPGVVAEVSKD